MSSDTSNIPQRFGSGRDVRRLGDESLLKGLGQFTDDVTLPDELRLVLFGLLIPMRASRRSTRRRQGQCQAWSR